MTRVTCGGVVDADDYNSDDIAALDALGIGVLPVSEIENLVLLPDVARTIAESEGFEGEALDRQLAVLADDVMTAASAAMDSAVMQYCRRRIDRILKKVDLIIVTQLRRINLRVSTLRGHKRSTFGRSPKLPSSACKLRLTRKTCSWR